MTAPLKIFEENLDQGNFLNVHRINAFLTVLGLKSYLISFTDVCRDKAAYMYENVFCSIIRNDKSKSFFFIEKFYDTFLHCF